MIENTARTAIENPLLTFAEMLGNPERGIEAQEARGQAQLVASHQLPREGDWEKLTELGFVRGEDTPGDDLFCAATIPEGWTKERTDHAMYSVIKDERGIKRVTVGYKAAFYDRWARITVNRPGADLASDLVYADDKTVPETWNLLTDEEKQDAFTMLEQGKTQYDDMLDRDPDGYWAARVKSYVDAEAALRAFDGQ